MEYYGHRWIATDRNGKGWMCYYTQSIRQDSNEILWTEMDSDGQQWIVMDTDLQKWIAMDILSYKMEKRRHQWNTMD